MILTSVPAIDRATGMKASPTRRKVMPQPTMPSTTSFAPHGTCTHSVGRSNVRVGVPAVQCADGFKKMRWWALMHVQAVGQATLAGWGFTSNGCR